MESFIFNPWWKEHFLFVMLLPLNYFFSINGKTWKFQAAFPTPPSQDVQSCIPVGPAASKTDAIWHPHTTCAAGWDGVALNEWTESPSHEGIYSYWFPLHTLLTKIVNRLLGLQKQPLWWLKNSSTEQRKAEMWWPGRAQAVPIPTGARQRLNAPAPGRLQRQSKTPAPLCFYGRLSQTPAPEH